MSVENVLGAQRPPVRVGIAGLGRAALFDHIPAFKALPGLYQVMAVCDLVKERRDIVEKDYPDVHTYRRVEDMLDDPEIDLVLVTFP
ncbi:MAG: Gfo/Idh/MocA family oxidoreductase, partial [bacterium]|nr:Gfo/Idh/MocA family oxidoreductase [bacterium]